MGPIRGSCLCGEVKFELAGSLIRPLNCHCSRCRKQHGAAFRSRVRVKADDFRWIRGESLVKYFESSPGFFRGFCSTCGSPVANRATVVSEIGVPMGVLDDDPGVRPECHIFVGSKAAWYEITDNLPKFAEVYS